MTLPLFPEPRDDSRPPQARRLASLLRAQVAKGVFWGTSSWKYEGWLGSVYSPDRYVTRGRFSKSKFDEGCLAEYAQTFSVVCGDFAFYQFPAPEYWQRLFAGTPEGFRFAFKVPEEITVAKWPSHVRYGPRGGQPNPGFLRTDVLRTRFLERLLPYRERVAALIFEFGTFGKSTFAVAEDFLERLGPFLGELPDGFRYAVEIRNPEYLGDAYFATLSAFNVAHVFTAWTRMPEIGKQAAMPNAWTADFAIARALLPKGRSYEQAVADLEPYDSIRTPNPTARDGLAAIAEEAIRRKLPAFLFVNNRLEGHAPSTIEAVADALEG